MTGTTVTARKRSSPRIVLRRAAAGEDIGGGAIPGLVTSIAWIFPPST